MESGCKDTFKTELEHLINKHSKENKSNTPDFILADYMANCLDVYNRTILMREAWYGKEVIENNEEGRL